MKIIRKSIVLFLTLSSLGLISGCSQSKNEKVDKAKICMDIYSHDETIYFPYKFDLNDYVDVDSDINADILKMSLLFDANSSDAAHPHFEVSDYPIESNYEKANFYKHLGLKDYKKVGIISETGYDNDDETIFTLGHGEVSKDNILYDICFVTFRDTGGGTQWRSNFDIGYDDDSYYKKTGEHPEWTNKDNHKGFDVAANRSLIHLMDYADEKLNKNAKHIYYIFGHSRGAAIANLVGAKLIDENYTAVSYACASPCTTTSQDFNNSKYNHLYNFINSDDFITGLLPTKWGFQRYGQTITFSLKDYRNNFEAINNVDYPVGNPSIILKGLARLSEGRNDLYQTSDKFLVVNSSPMEKDKVDEYLKPYTNCFKDEFENYQNFVNIEQIEGEDGLITVKITTCVGLFTSLLGYSMSLFGINFSKIFDSLSELSIYIQPFLEASKLNATSLLSLTGNFIVYMHFYYAYITYANI